MGTSMTGQWPSLSSVIYTFNIYHTLPYTKLYHINSHDITVHSTPLYDSTLGYSTIQHNALHYSTIQHNALPYIALLHFHTYITVQYSTEMQCITLYTDHTYSTIPFRYVTLHEITLHYIVFCIALHCIASHYLSIYLSIYLLHYYYMEFHYYMAFHYIVTWLVLIHIEFKTSLAWRVRRSVTSRREVVVMYQGH